jgi:hypothetical protein
MSLQLQLLKSRDNYYFSWQTRALDVKAYEYKNSELVDKEDILEAGKNVLPLVITSCPALVIRLARPQEWPLIPSWNTLG